jgi:hypothetical protein
LTIAYRVLREGRPYRCAAEQTQWKRR